MFTSSAISASELLTPSTVKRRSFIERRRSPTCEAAVGRVYINNNYRVDYIICSLYNSVQNVCTFVVTRWEGVIQCAPGRSLKTHQYKVSLSLNKERENIVCVFCLLREGQ